MRSRILATCAALALVAIACSNSPSAKSPAATTPKGGSGAKTSVTEVTGAALKQNIPLKGVQGVTDSEIQVVVITSGTNPLAGDYRTFADGIQAYFNMVNADGGIYGRKLVISAQHDDGFINNQQTVKKSLAEDHAFATFVATPLFYGAPDLAASKPPMPTFTWNINQEFAGKPNFFANLGALCFTCKGQVNPFIAQEAGLERVAVLAYSAPAASPQCAAGVKGSFEKYPSAKVVYFDDNIPLGSPDLSAQVAQMKKKQVQLVFTCMDQREVVILAKEMAKQHLDAVQGLPNLYDPQYVKANAQYLEGDYVGPQFAALEMEPQIPIEQKFVEWMGKLGKPVAELPGYGWINALQLVHALKLAGPNFSQQKVIDSLNQDTAFSAEGMIVPIDWTISHSDPAGPDGTVIPKYAGEWECTSLTKIVDGEFVPVFNKPGKQFTCMVGGPNAPTLTKTPTYESFVPSAG